MASGSGDCAQMRPPCASTMPFAIASPRPAPAASGWSASPSRVRVVALAALALLALPLYARVNAVSGTFLARPTTLLWPLLGLSALYSLARALIVGASEPRSRRVAFIELGVLLLAGVAFRAFVIGSPPLLSHDAYRYAWDPYLLAHGVSPYLHAPNDPALIPLRDGAIWPLLNWRDAPTIYPSGAQAFFFLVYLVKPLSIWAVKTAITASDAVLGLLLLALLRRRGLDLRLTLLYWWSPIAIIEFAGNAHIDAVAVAWVLLAPRSPSAALSPPGARAMRPPPRRRRWRSRPSTSRSPPTPSPGTSRSSYRSSRCS